MREFFITLLSPAARKLGRINPNTLTIFSLIAGVLAGFAYGFTHLSSWFYLLGGTMVAISGFADSLDGIVARMYKRITKKGDFLDHFCDRIVDVAILSGLAFSRGAHSSLGFFLIVLVLLHSYSGTQIEATLGKRSYEGTGKAELFVGFVVFSLIATIFPNISMDFVLNKIVLADIFIVILCGATLISLIKRFLQGIKLCILSDKKE